MTNFFTKACVVILILCNTAAFAGHGPPKNMKRESAKKACWDDKEIERRTAILYVAAMTGAFSPEEGLREIKKIRVNACNKIDLSSIYDSNADKHYVNNNPETPASSEESTAVGSRAS